MRIARWMPIALVGCFIITGELSAQTSTRRSAASQVQRGQRVAANESARTRPTPATTPVDAKAAATNAPNAPAGNNPVDARIAREIQSMEQMIEQATAVLQKKMAHAAQIRQDGLKKEDRRLLDQAEQMERQAIAAYEKQLKHIETLSQRISENSKAIAEQTATRANRENVNAASAAGANNSNARSNASKPRQPTPSRYYYRGRSR